MTRKLPPGGLRPHRPIAVAAVAAAGIALVAVAAIWLWQVFGSGPPAIPPASDERAMAVGAALYSRHCASCHGAGMEGQPNWRERKPDGRLPAPPHDETGHTWHHADDVLFRITKEGLKAVAPPGYLSDMPDFGGVLTDREIAAVLGYIKSTWPPSIRDRQTRLSAGGR